MDDVKIIESGTSAEWRPWEPPMWLIALGLCAALLVGLAQSGNVRDPRLGNEASPSPCVPTVVTQAAGTSYTWTFCPER